MSLNISGNKNAFSAYNQINALENKTGLRHGLSQDQLKAITLYIENELPRQVQQGNVYFKKEETGLARTIEYDTDSKRIFIHLKRKGGVEQLGQGGAKVVTRSILYDVDKPEYVALSVFKIAENQRELEYIDSFKGAPGVVQLLSINSHFKEKNQSMVNSFVTPFYMHGSLQNFMFKTPLTTLDKVSLSKDVLNSLNSLHDRDIAHGDVHKGNFLIGTRKDASPSNYQAIVTDLGTAHPADKAAKIGDLKRAGCMLYELLHDSHHIPSHWHGTLTPAAQNRKNELTAKNRPDASEEFELLLLNMIDPGEAGASAEFYEDALNKILNKLQIESLHTGGSLKSLRESMKLTLQEKVSLADDVLGALNTMHAKGIVHNNLHDGNLLMIKNEDGNSYRASLPELRNASRDAHNPLYVTKDFFAAGCMFYEILHDTHRLPQHWDKLNLFPRLAPEKMPAGSLLLGDLGEATQRWRHLCGKLENSSLTPKEQFEWQILELMHPRV